MNESFKTDPSLATSARAANESGSYLCASNVTPTAVRFIVSVFLCLLCSCRMPSTQMTCSHFRKNRPKKRQKPAGCRSRIISKNRPVPIFGRSTGASLVEINGKCVYRNSCTISLPETWAEFSISSIVKKKKQIHLQVKWPTDQLQVCYVLLQAYSFLFLTNSRVSQNHFCGNQTCIICY